MYHGNKKEAPERRVTAGVDSHKETQTRMLEFEGKDREESIPRQA